VQGAAQYRRSTSGGRIGAREPAPPAQPSRILEIYERVSSKSDEIRASDAWARPHPLLAARCGSPMRSARPYAPHRPFGTTCRSQMIRSRSLMTDVASVFETQILIMAL
jgi:hypothetical protein